MAYRLASRHLGALRYFARGDLDEPNGEQILRRYFSASLISVYAIRRLIEAWPFVSTCSIHGIYVPHGVIPALTRKKNIRSVHWSHAYRKHTFVFSHGDSYHHTMMQEPTSGWGGMAWTEQMEFEIVDYLKSRWSGARDWIWYGENQIGPLSDVPQIDPSRPCVGLLTNVVWDAQVSFRNNAFPNMIEWVLQTIKYFSNRPDLQLLIRVHPAEVKHGIKSQQPIIHEIMKAFGTLPCSCVHRAP